jgi:ABC-2 type transport system ATP-binding protein
VSRLERAGNASPVALAPAMAPTPDPSEPIVVLSTKGVAKSYGDLIALEPLDLSVPEGQRLVLVGHNGSGKTTLLRMAAGLLEPTSGEVSIIGAAAGSLEARAAVSYLPDNPVLYDDLSVLEHIEYVCRLHEADDWQTRAVGLLDALALTDRADDLPSRFSRGLRQKTAILLGLIRPFSLLLIDEPFVGLDPPGREALVELLDDANDSGATVVVATHQMDFVRRADRCVALRDGAVIFDGPPDDVDVNTLAG